MGRRSDPKRDAKIAKLNEKGLFHAEIAERVGMSRVGVAQALRRLGVRSAHTCGRPVGSAGVIGPRSSTVEMIALRKSGMTLQAVGDVFGVSRQAVCGAVKFWEGRL
jgi:transcriptional regulator